jgi:hypothetical protein
MKNKKNHLTIKSLAWVLTVVFVLTSGYFTVFAQEEEEGTGNTISISGPNSVNENTAAGYTAIVRFRDGSTRTVTSSATWSENSQYATISGGVLRASSVTSNQTVTITARYTYRENTMTATKSVTIVNVSGAKTLNSLSVTGPSSVNGGATASYIATAAFSDGSSQNVTASSTWTVSSSAATISSSGVLTATRVTTNQTVTVTARYSSGGVSRTATRSVTIVAVSGTRTLSSLAVAGASSVNTGATASYNATATFSDGSTQNVTTSSTWRVSSNAATISSSGVLTAAQITTNSVVTVTASYTYGGVTRTASIPVTIVAVTSTRTLSSLAVAGASSVNGGSTSSYMATATFNDGTTQNVTTSSTWTVSSTAATISSSGLLTATQVTATQNITVTASYTYSGVTRSGNLGVAILVSGGGTSTSKSINSTSQNRTSLPTTLVAEQPLTKLSGYNILAVNDLGMHCGDLDHRVVSILPPFNVLHALVIKQGTSTTVPPSILTSSSVNAIYSAASNPSDPALLNPTTSSVYKTNFWDANAVTGNSIAYDGYNPFYPPNVLSASVMTKDSGLPFPDLNILYPVSGTGTLSAAQQKMPGGSGAYTANTPQLFNLFNVDFPFFTNFAFGYRASGVNWFAADGIPLAPYDDVGRTNPFVLMRVQARTINTGLTGTSNQVITSVDTVAPVSGEATCYVCHTSTADGGNGQAACLPGYDSGCTAAGSMRSTARFAVVTAAQDPSSGIVPASVSKEWAADMNILLLHDAKNATQLATGSKPVVCQKCHYSPALDLAQVGPLGSTSASANGRTQTTHHSNSRALHAYHAQFADLFAAMVPPNNSQRSTGGVPTINTYIQTTLNNSCYRCHPGQTTRCLRGAMYNGGLICQDCHGNMQQVGNDFSVNMSSSTPYPGGANMTLRVPWAKEPACGSCHSGDAMSNLTTSANVIKSNDNIRLLQAYRTNDLNATPIVPTNTRFAEETASNGNKILFRLSKGHSGIACQACHGSTHAEWPVEPQSGTSIANDNLAATQIQGHTGMIIECTACHASGSLSATLGGPHSMHPVNDSRFSSGHSNLVSSNRAQCQACHGQTGQGTVLSKVAANRSLSGRTLTKGQMVSCGTCHGNPL